MIAGVLWDARVLSRPCDPPTLFRPDLSLAGAYQVSKYNFERRLKENDAKRAGSKIGLTSQAVQKQLNVSQPDFGWLTSDMQLSSGGMIPKTKLIQPKVEGEVAFILKKDLQGPTHRDAVIGATDSVAACIEVIDSRVSDWKIKIEDTVADNASSAYYVLGAQRRPLSEVDLVKASMTLKINGETRSTGAGAACLGDPVNAVLWLANTFGLLGETLRAGDVILSGAYGPVVPFQPGDRCEVEIDGLGRVTCERGR